MSLAKLASAVWASWLGLLAWMAGSLVLHTWHPHFVIPSALIGVMFFATLLLFVQGGWQLLFSPARRKVAQVLLLGSAPLLFMAAHGAFGLAVSQSRQIPLNWPLKLLMPLSEATFDVVTRVQYPHRDRGAKVEMISTGSPTAAQEVAAMDAHIGRLEQILHGTVPGRIRWVRGPLLGMDGKAAYSTCIGSGVADGRSADPEGLTSLDRHEVAHCVIAGLCDATINPPALLCEGWAEANSGGTDIALAMRAADAREVSNTLPLSVLVGPDWYERHEWKVYLQGAPLVRYLLKRYGAERFLEFYRTSHPKTINEDFRRVLGVSLAELDRDYWKAIDEIIADAGGRDRALLAQWEVAPAVGPARWNEFLDRYVPAAQRLRQPSRAGKETVVVTYDLTPANKPPTRRVMTYCQWRRGDEAVLKITTDTSEQQFVARRENSFWASRTLSSGTWQLYDQTGDPQARLAHMRKSITARAYYDNLSAWLFDLSEELLETTSPPIRVERLERTGAEPPQYRLEIVNRPKPRTPFAWRRAFVVLDARTFAMQTVDYDVDETVEQQVSERPKYFSDTTVPVLKSYRVNFSPKGDLRFSNLEVTARSSAEATEQEMELAARKGEPAVHISTEVPAEASSWLARVAYSLAAAGALSLIGGGALASWGAIFRAKTAQ